jgi:hypothetical protein
MTEALRFKRGMLGYATILRFLQNGPCTARQLAEGLSMPRRTAGMLLRQLRYRRLVHVSGWVRERAKGAPSSILAFGGGPDCPCIPGATGQPAGRLADGAPPMAVEMLTFALIWHALEEPQSVRSIWELSGIDPHTAYKLVHHLRALRLIHLAEWDTTVARVPVPLFSLGQRRDARRPEPEGHLASWRRYEQRRRARSQAARFTRMIAGPICCAVSLGQTPCR